MSAEAQRLECIDAKLGRLLGAALPALGAQGGEVGTAIVAQLRTTGEAAAVDFNADLGRPATSFTVTNLGNTAAVWFKTGELQAEAQSSLGPLYLLPNTTRTFARRTEIVEVKPAGDGPVWVQVDAL